MFILILTLLFGAAVLWFTLRSYKKAKINGGDGKLVSILRLVVMFEALLYMVIFIFVFLKTLFM